MMSKREQERRDREQRVAYAQIVVREAGYNAAVLKATGEFDQAYSRAHSIYSVVCILLRMLDGDANAEEFIRLTYNSPA